MMREEDEFRMKQEESMWQVKAEIAEAKAREEVFSQSCVDGREVLVMNDQIKSKSEPSENKQLLNPEAAVWTDTKAVYSVQPPSQYSIQDNSLLYMMKSITDQQQEAAASLSLPKDRSAHFHWRTTEYCNFICAFESLIEAKTNSARSRLHYLVQYTSDDVKELMSSCLSMEPNTSYEEARRLLKKRFCQNCHIATAYVDKITKGAPCKTEDSKAMQRLSTLMTSCKNTWDSRTQDRKSRQPTTDHISLTKLYDLRRRWRSTADRTKVHDIVTFVEKEARTVSHQIFGDITSKETTEKKHSKVSQQKQKATHSFKCQITSNTTTAEQKPHFNFKRQETPKPSAHQNISAAPVVRKCIMCENPSCVKIQTTSWTLVQNL